jgi:hypothetical protein
MNRRSTLAALTVLAGLTVLAAAPRTALAQTPPKGEGPGWWRISPKSTFYRTSNDPQSTSSFFFLLDEMPGTYAAPMVIEIFGDYKMSNAEGDNRNVLHGVFTRTPTILAANLQRRLPDAIPASRTTTSGPTYHGALATEIPEDFRITPDATGKYVINVPAGAQWIVVCIADSYYGDNSDPDNDLWIRFSRQY